MIRHQFCRNEILPKEKDSKAEENVDRKSPNGDAAEAAARPAVNNARQLPAAAEPKAG